MDKGKTVMQGRYKISLIIVLVASVAVFSYIATKSTVASFTHDESFSFLRYTSQSFMDIISNQAAYTNNHVLNTLGMKYAAKIFGSSEIALRLPNLIMLLVFFTYTFLLLYKCNPVLGTAIFILMITNTVLIDFFGLARGYGMSIGFMAMSLYHLIHSFNGKAGKHLVLFNIGVLLAVLSSFTMLSFYFSALLVFNLVHAMQCRFILNEKFSFWKTNKMNIICFFFLLIILYEPVRKAVKFNSFDFGGKQGFVTDTVTSVLYHMFTNVHLSQAGMQLSRVLILMITGISFMIIIVNTIRSNKAFFSHSRELILVNLLILAISAETILQHYILKSDYLIGRFSLFLFPLFILNTGFLLEYLVQFRFRYIIYFVAVSLAVLSVSNFYLNRNFQSMAEWGYDMETKNAVEALVKDQERVPSKIKHVRLGINWLFEPTINFYRQTRKIGWLLPVDRNGLTESDDYCYIFKADTAALRNKNYAVIFSSDKTNTVLIKNFR